MDIMGRNYMLITCWSLRVNHRSIGSFFDMKLFQSVSTVWMDAMALWVVRLSLDPELKYQISDMSAKKV